MLRINQLKLQVGHSKKELMDKIIRTLRLTEKDIQSFSIRKQSLDARHKPDLFYVYTVDVQVVDDASVLKKLHKKHQDKNIELCEPTSYHFPEMGEKILAHRPVVIGCGPAGLYCAYYLAKYGYKPLLIERGAPVEERQKDVESFWKTGILDPESNVQFGEGGAGTFSDGKLNTLVKDPSNRIQEVLRVFVEHGAPEEIMYVNKPHIGTDILCDVIRNLRMNILKYGGEILFHTKMEGIYFDTTGQRVKGVCLHDLKNDNKWNLDADVVILAPGHSARDTFFMLHEKEIPMEPKAFAVGFRIEHSQKLIDESQYGKEIKVKLPAAPYKLATKLPDGRGVYTFCMCPGGYVVNASSEDGHLAVNGMSYYARDSHNANSAVICTVTPEDFGGEGPLAGVVFQRKLEKATYEAGKGMIPVQRYGDFYYEIMNENCINQSSDLKVEAPCMKGEYSYTSLKNILPEVINKSLIQGIEDFDKKIKGYANPDSLLSAVESRTSSPIRILRDSDFESEVKGLYPCGEGAGYAGGITSAAMDGLKIAEAIRKKYRVFDTSNEL